MGSAIKNQYPQSVAFLLLKNVILLFTTKFRIGTDQFTFLTFLHFAQYQGCTFLLQSRLLCAPGKKPLLCGGVYNITICAPGNYCEPANNYSLTQNIWIGGILLHYLAISMVLSNAGFKLPKIA